MATHRADDNHLDYDGQISFVELVDWMLKRKLWVDPMYQDMLDFMEDDVKIQFAIPSDLSAMQRQFYERKALNLGLEVGDGDARNGNEHFFRKLLGPAVVFPGHFAEKLLRGADIDNHSSFDTDKLEVSIEGDLPQPWLISYDIPEMEALIHAVKKVGKRRGSDLGAEPDNSLRGPYRAVSKVAVREGFATDSPTKGTVLPGEEVEVLESRRMVKKVGKHRGSDLEEGGVIWLRCPSPTRAFKRP
jgi:hypothetical protein